jgi:hypothetical protein
MLWGNPKLHVEEAPRNVFLAGIIGVSEREKNCTKVEKRFFLKKNYICNFSIFCFMLSCARNMLYM